MSFLNKVKDFFYEEEDVNEEKSYITKTIENKFKENNKNEDINKYEEINFKHKSKKTNQDIPERELFNVERTFNFPMDFDEDNIFDKEEPKKEEPKKENIVNPTTRMKKKQVNNTTYRFEPKKEEPKKFKPTPVISPVYGILDIDYKVDDVENISRTKEFSFEKRVVDYDSVRNKAYKELDDEIEKTITKNRDIFYNLDEEENNDQEIGNDNKESDDVIITYDKKEEVIAEQPKKKTTRTKKVTEEIEKDDLDTEDEDLFNLIDNMYKSEEDDEE